jgi:hypothetical protein
MAWTNSKIFRQWIADSLAPTASFAGKWGVGTPDTYKAALFPTGTTPDATVTAANSAYNAGVWTSGTELTDTNWPAGGRAITSPTFTSSGTTITYDGADTSGAGNVTLAGVFGNLFYDDTLTTPVADQGAAFHYYGGSQGVTGGTFTIVWNASGLMQVTF